MRVFRLACVHFAKYCSFLIWPPLAAEQITSRWSLDDLVIDPLSIHIGR